MQANLRRLPTVAAALLLFGCEWTGLAGSANFKEDFSHSYSFSPGGRLSVETFNGSIEVTAWDRSEVQITGTKYASSEELLAALKVDIVATGDFIQVRTVRPSGRRGNMGARYVIHAPRRVELDRLTSSNGAVTVEGTEGVARIETSNGRIRLVRVNGDVEAETSNGGVELSETGGSAVIRTSNGAIRADSVRGHLRAKTSNGSVNARLLSDGDSRPVEVQTSNGSVNLTLLEQPASDVIVSTSNSSITVHAPDSLRASLEADTSNSSVNTDFDVMARGAQSKSRLEGTINGGGPLIKLDSSNGAIRLVKGAPPAD